MCLLLTFVHELSAPKTAYRKKSFPSKESDTKLLQSIDFDYEVGVINSYSNRIKKRCRICHNHNHRSGITLTRLTCNYCCKNTKQITAMLLFRLKMHGMLYWAKFKIEKSYNCWKLQRMFVKLYKVIFLQQA